MYFVISFTYAQKAKQIFEAPNLATAVATHKTVGILPFEVTIKMKKLPKGVTQEQIIEQQKTESKNVQNSMYTFLLRKAKDKNYTVTFQDVTKTNTLLAKQDITIDNLGKYTKDEIAKILGVDAIISGNLVTDKVMSEGGAIALGLLIGFWGKTSEASVTMNIHNGTDGELLWRYDREVAGGVGNSTDDMVNRIMRQVARNFPYDK